jgi:hypothetical protein
MWYCCNCEGCRKFESDEWKRGTNFEVSVFEAILTVTSTDGGYKPIMLSHHPDS